MESNKILIFVRI